ncbi:MAG TPA: 2'-5' RNA ligase family protein [Nocardioidaceae bacterium]|nr:2'-5' RNA ligase family protein [Nocardioidaceae bacterium]
MTTIGVAVAVPEPWATQLQEYRESLGDETASTIPTHITLMPPIDVDDSLLPGIQQHLLEVSANQHAFRIHLRGTGTFRPVSPVVFVGVVEGISECEQLALAVRRGPLAIDAEFPYHPHVTIAHHLADDSLDRAFQELGSFECEFLVEHFWLYVHQDRRGWSPTRNFPLTARAD